MKFSTTIEAKNYRNTIQFREHFLRILNYKRTNGRPFGYTKCLARRAYTKWDKTSIIKTELGLATYLEYCRRNGCKLYGRKVEFYSKNH